MYHEGRREADNFHLKGDGVHYSEFSEDGDDDVQHGDDHESEAPYNSGQDDQSTWKHGHV